MQVRESGGLRIKAVLETRRESMRGEKESEDGKKGKTKGV